MRRLLAALVVGTLALGSCGDGSARVGIGGSTTSTTGLPTIPAPGTPEQARLDAARARWKASGTDDYRWTYTRTCFCPQLTVAVTVEAGEAVDHQVTVVGGRSSGVGGELEILTMPDLYEEVQRAIDTADSLTVAYEPETGRILSLDVDRFENAIDDEYGYAVTSLVGTDLFASWCDDLIMADDPVPRTEETWRVVAGTVTFLEDVGSLGGACERPVAARLVGVVVERPDGTHVSMADREVRNSCWNGAAG